MEKVTISTDKCKAGMKTAETVFNNYGAVIVVENTILDDFMINKLQLLGISKIKVFQEADKKIEANSKLKESYSIQLGVVVDMINDINSGRDLEIDKVNEIVHFLMETGKENRDILSCMKQVKDVDKYTYTHCINVSLLAMMIGRWLKLDEKKVQELTYAGLLHDIGKARIDLNILNKPGKLTPEEYEEIKKHVTYGKEILQEMPGISQDIIAGVSMHHERENGSGYAEKVAGENIHQYAKIISVADVFDAMTSNRVYRGKQSIFDVFEFIQSCTFREFDPNVALTFLNNMSGYYIGSMCRLSDGQIAEIIYINSNNISRPLVKVGETYIDLSKDMSVKIVEVL